MTRRARATTRRLWFNRALLSGVAVVLGLVVTEGLLRMVRYGEDYPDAQLPKYLRVYDPYRGFFLRPNQQINWKSPCFDIRGLTINAFGMRDRPRQLESNGVRVALLGDSFLRAFEVDNDQAINRVLEELVPGVEFLNFGESGYGTVQSYQTYVHAAAPFHPKLVIYCMYPNDVIDNHPVLRAWREHVPGVVKPGFRDYPDLVNQGGQWALVQPADRLSSMNWKNWCRARSRVYLLAKRGRDHLRDASKQRAADQVAEASVLFPAAQDVAVPRAHFELAVDMPPANRYWHEALAITQEAIHELHAAVKADGAQLIIVGIPTKANVRIDAEGFAAVAGFPQPPTFRTTYLYDTVETWLKQEQIPFLNLRASYERFAHREHLDPRSLYYGCNTHWNAQGHRVTAELVVAFLRGHWPEMPSDAQR